MFHKKTKRRNGKGRARRYAREDLQTIVKERPYLQPVYEAWLRWREQAPGGSGCVTVDERPLAGDGLFWQVSQRDEVVLFLFSPQRVVKALRSATDV